MAKIVRRISRGGAGGDRKCHEIAVQVLETCLLIFVGVDKDQRAEAERLRREVEKSSSRVRNLSFDIKQTKDRLADIEKTLKGKKRSKDDDKTRLEFKELSERAKVGDSAVLAIEDKIRDTKLTIADSASRSSALRNEYNAEFANRIAAKKSSRQHPLIQQAVVDSKCVICGSSGPTVTSVVKARLDASECPFTDRTGGAFEAIAAAVENHQVTARVLLPTIPSIM